MTTKEQIDNAARTIRMRLEGLLEAACKSNPRCTIDDVVGALEWLSTLARSAVPSGQVGEDVSEGERIANIFIQNSVARISIVAVISRLAAGAQRTQQAEQDRDDARAGLEHCEGERAAHDAAATQYEKDLKEKDARIAWVEKKWAEASAAKSALRAEVERLKAHYTNREASYEGVIASLRREAEEQRKRAEVAESRLAAVRERFLNTAEINERLQGIDSTAWQKAWGALRWVLEGDATNSPRLPESSPNLSMPSNGSGHYPCSDTCTHGDAATPGHPERVKERSEAFEQLVWSKERSADWRFGFEDGKERGAEAMRAACWEAVASLLTVEGLCDSDALYNQLKRAIESATP